MRRRLLWLYLVLSLPAFGAEMSFRFDEFPINEQPPGFTNLLYGKGPPGEWKIIMDDVPPLIEPATSKAPVVTRKPVLAQLSRNPTDERYPLLLYEKETFGDFTLTTRFKIVDGVMEQMAGVVFRALNETNFYVVRADGVGNTLRFYKVINGERAPMLGPKLEISRNIWHELKIGCKGNQIHIWFDGQEATPMITDSTFTSGRIGYWTKSDAISYFSDTTITYVPREPLAQVIVRQTLKENPRLMGLKISKLDENGGPIVIASKEAGEVGTAGTETEKQVIANGTIYHIDGRTSTTVVMPLRDRNGDPIAAVSVQLKSFTGQTTQTAITRAMVIVKDMQRSVQSLKELAE